MGKWEEILKQSIYMIFTLILLPDINFGTCRCCFFAIQYQLSFSSRWILSLGWPISKHQARFPQVNKLFCLIKNTRSLHYLWIEKWIIQVGGCLVCGVAAGGSDTFHMVTARWSVSLLLVALLCAKGPFACYYWMEVDWVR